MRGRARLAFRLASPGANVITFISRRALVTATAGGDHKACDLVKTPPPHATPRTAGGITMRRTRQESSPGNDAAFTQARGAPAATTSGRARSWPGDRAKPQPSGPGASGHGTA